MLLHHPHHVKLVAACYNTQPAPVQATFPAPDSAALSRLQYYASTRPGKVPKISVELLRRVKYSKSLALTLQIARAVIDVTDSSALATSLSALFQLINHAFATPSVQILALRMVSLLRTAGHD